MNPFDSTFTPFDQFGGISGGLADDDGGPRTLPDGEYFEDELTFQDPRQAAMGAMLMNMGQPAAKRDPNAVSRAVMMARAHNTRVRRMMQPRYQVVDGRLLKFNPNGKYAGTEQDFRDPNRNDVNMAGVGIVRPNESGTYDTVMAAPQEPVNPFDNTKAMGSDTLLGRDANGGITTLWEREAGAGGTIDQTKVPEYANTLRDDLRQSTSGYETALETYPIAMSLGNIYANNASTREDKTQADRGLVNLSVKLFDPTSAVLGGEFDSAAEAQAYFSKLMKKVDPTTGEILDDDTRKAMLRLVHNSAQHKIGQLTERYNDYIGPATRLVGAENLDLVLPSRVLDNGKIKSNLYDLSPFEPALNWAGIDWVPPEQRDLLSELDSVVGGKQ